MKLIPTISSICILALLSVIPSNFAWAQASSADSITPLKVGDSVPDSKLLRVDGKESSLKTVLGESPGLLIFFRGGW